MCSLCLFCMYTFNSTCYHAIPYLSLPLSAFLLHLFFQGGFTGVGRFSGYQTSALNDVGVLIWIMRSSARKLHVVN